MWTPPFAYTSLSLQTKLVPLPKLLVEKVMFPEEVAFLIKTLLISKLSSVIKLTFPIPLFNSYKYKSPCSDSRKSSKSIFDLKNIMIALLPVGPSIYLSISL